MPKPLSLRAVNRATLARQLLLKRAKLKPLEALEQLFALQAQVPRPPYVALWTRLHGFKRDTLTGLLEKRAVVRATTMRNTLHLMSAKDYLALRSALQPGMDKALRGILRDRLDALDVPALTKLAHDFFAERPRPFDALREALTDRFPKVDIRAAAYAVRCTLPLVQVPDGSEWGFSSTADFVPVEPWLKKAPAAKPAAEALVLRYLAAFGPATAADAQAFTAVPSLADVFHSLRSQLVVLKDERGRELFDLPDAPRPDEDTPAPVRLLAEFDSLVLAYADRTRLVDAAHRSALSTKNLQIPGTVLVDGFVAGTWKASDKGLLITPLKKLSRAEIDAVNEEAQGLVQFLGREEKVTIQPWSA